MSNKPEFELDGELPEELAEMLRLGEEEEISLENHHSSKEFEESSRLFFMAWWASFWQWLTTQRKAEKKDSAMLVVRQTKEKIKAHDDEVDKQAKLFKKVFQEFDQIIKQNFDSLYSKFGKDQIFIYRDDTLNLHFVLFKEHGLRVWFEITRKNGRDRSLNYILFDIERRFGMRSLSRDFINQGIVKDLLGKGITAEDIAQGFARIVNNVEDDFFE